jgi:hypothetical protein
MEFKKCTNCDDWHFDNEACSPAYIVTQCDTGISTKVRGVSHWHAARFYGIKTWHYIENSHALVGQKMTVDVMDERGESERYILSVEFCANKVEQDKTIPI